MLCLTRKIGEVVVVNGNIRIIISGIDRGKVVLAFDCDKKITIFREELLREMEEKNESKT